MITTAQAKKKILQINPSTDKVTKQLLLDILDRKLEYTQKESFRKPEYKDLTLWIEDRLAQPHLKYLAPDQVNTIWGGSTTNALVALGKQFSIAVDKKSPIIGATLLTALLDGSKSNEEKISAKPNSYDWFKQVYTKLGYEKHFRNGPMQFNVCGIRGYLNLEPVRNFGDEWNDTLFLVWIDKAGVKHVKPYAASTDAGLYYYRDNPVPGECAHLIEGVWDYEPGPHNGRPAFIQAGKVTVARTNTANYDDSTPRTTDNYPHNPYWINIHMGWEYGAESVYNSSAGCQVIKSAGETGWQWVDFRDTLYLNVDRKFKYMLVNSTTLQKIKAL